MLQQRSEHLEQLGRGVIRDIEMGRRTMRGTMMIGMCKLIGRKLRSLARGT